MCDSLTLSIKKRLINHLAGLVCLGTGVDVGAASLTIPAEQTRLEQHQKKKKPSLIRPTFTNQHGENYIWVEEMNKSWLNVAAEVGKKKVLRIGCSLSDVDQRWGKGEAT